MKDRLTVKAIEADGTIVQYGGVGSALITAVGPFRRYEFTTLDPENWHVGDFVDVTIEKVNLRKEE